MPERRRNPREEMSPDQLAEYLKQLNEKLSTYTATQFILSTGKNTDDSQRQEAQTLFDNLKSSLAQEFGGAGNLQIVLALWRQIKMSQLNVLPEEK